MVRCLLALALAPALAHGVGTVAIEPPVAYVPPAWKVAGVAPREHMLELTFAVKQTRVPELTETLLKVSDPSSPEYGKHMTNEEVNRLIAPQAAHIEAVEAFIRSHGLEPRRTTPNGDFIVAVASVEVAEAMLSTKYSKVAHSSGTEINRALGGYSLPADVAAAVDLVAPTTHIPGVHRPTRSLQSSVGDDYNSPKNLRTLYQIGTVEGKAANNKQAVTAFLGQGYTTDSLQKFWDKFCDGIHCGKGMPKLVGDATGGSPGTESMLDIQTITGIAGNVESEFWGFSGRSPDNPENEPFMKWLQKLSSTSDADAPKIFSTSYGEDESSWHEAAAARLNTEFQKAGARGISLLFASGDNGPNCQGGKFMPNGPASSPWVTAVGGTAPGSSWPKPGADAETGIGLGSGGFSNYWAMPDWQSSAVASYLKQSGVPQPSDKGFNVSGRAFPDISAQATDFFVYAGFPEPGVAGTSCASPTAAGVFALLNDLRLQAGKSSLGFLNPLIYKHADAFNDITTGASRSSCGEWPAKQGWDAATGVGTPNYEKLAKVVATLPAGHTASSIVV